MCRAGSVFLQARFENFSMALARCLMGRIAGGSQTVFTCFHMFSQSLCTRGREFQSPSRRGREPCLSYWSAGATPRIDVASLDVASLTKPPPELPAKLAEDYEDTEPLGEGAFAIVRRLRKKQDGGLAGLSGLESSRKFSERSSEVALKVVEKCPGSRICAAWHCLGGILCTSAT